MSMSMLKKSMAIVEEDLEENKKAKEKKIIETKIKRLHKPNRGKDVFSNTMTQKKTIEDIRKELQLNSKRADDNVKRLLALSKHTVKIPNAEKMIQRAHSGRYIVEKKQEEVQESVFTEEDFAAFEKELAQTL